MKISIISPISKSYFIAISLFIGANSSAYMNTGKHIGSNNDGDWYLYTGSIKKNPNGNDGDYWATIVTNYKSPEKDGTRSVFINNTYHCGEKIKKSITIHVYSGHKDLWAEGDQTYRNPPNIKRNIALSPGSIMALVFDNVCGYAKSKLNNYTQSIRGDTAATNLNNSSNSPKPSSMAEQYRREAEEMAARRNREEVERAAAELRDSAVRKKIKDILKVECLATVAYKTSNISYYFYNGYVIKDYNYLKLDEAIIFIDEKNAKRKSSLLSPPNNFVYPYSYDSGVVRFSYAPGFPVEIDFRTMDGYLQNQTLDGPKFIEKLKCTVASGSPDKL